MKRAILNVILINFSLVSGLFADEGKNFEELKTKMLQRTGAQLARLTEHKSCISAATKKEELKACRDKRKAWRDANKGQKGQNP